MRILKDKKGFTLVELLVVLVILAILAAAIIPSMMGFIDKAKEENAYAEIRVVAVAARCAQQELYGKGEIDKSTHVLYNPNHSSAEEHDERFAEITEALVADSAIWSNVQSIFMSDDLCTVFYRADGVTYTYRATADGTTITTQ